MEEKNILFRDTEVIDSEQASFRKAHTAAVSALQRAFTSLVELGITPTLETLKLAVFKADWSGIRDQFTEETRNQLPILVKPARERFEKGVAKLAQELAHFKEDFKEIPLDFTCIELLGDEGVCLNPQRVKENEARIEERFTLYADTDSKRAVYQAVRDVENAVENLKATIAKAPKRDLTQFEKTVEDGHVRPLHRVFLPSDIEAIGIEGKHSLITLFGDGSLKVNFDLYRDFK